MQCIFEFCGFYEGNVFVRVSLSGPFLKVGIRSEDFDVCRDQ